MSLTPQRSGPFTHSTALFGVLLCDSSPACFVSILLTREVLGLRRASLSLVTLPILSGVV
jgi:hypothetical protein